MSADLQAELEDVKTILKGIPDELESPLREMVMAQLDTLKPYWRALFVLAAGTHEDEPSGTKAKRVYLAAALEMLNLAQNIHKHLIQNDTQNADSLTNKSFIGSMILAGDYCFSRSAKLAAYTDSPKVVSIFAEALGSISEGQLRLFGKHNETSTDTHTESHNTARNGDSRNDNWSERQNDASSLAVASYNELPKLLYAGTTAAIEIANIGLPNSESVLQAGKLATSLYIQHNAKDSVQSSDTQRVSNSADAENQPSSEPLSASDSLTFKESDTSTNIVQILSGLSNQQRPRWEFLFHHIINSPT